MTKREKVLQSQRSYLHDVSYVQAIYPFRLVQISQYVFHVCLFRLLILLNILVGLSLSKVKHSPYFSINGKYFPDFGWFKFLVQTNHHETSLIGEIFKDLLTCLSEFVLSLFLKWIFIFLNLGFRKVKSVFGISLLLFPLAMDLLWVSSEVNELVLFICDWDLQTVEFA